MSITTEKEHELIGLLYESVLDTRAWERFFLSLVECLNLRSANLATMNIENGAICAYFEGGESVNAHYRQLYTERYSREDELALLALENPPGMLFCSHDLPADVYKRIHHSAFYREWAIPQGIFYAVISNIRIEGSWRTMFMAHRNLDQGEFSMEARQFFARLIPHLQRASQLHMRLSELAQDQADLRDVMDRFAYGVAIVDDQGYICHTNSAAEQLLADLLDRVGGHQRLSLVDAALSRRLNLSLFEAVRASVGLENDRRDIFVLNNNEQGRLIFLVMPFSPSESRQRQRALLILYQPEKIRLPDPEIISVLWKLSPAETVLVCELVKGHTLDDCAHLLNRSKETLRGYLKSIFTKTGTNRQSDLIAQVLTSPAMI